MHLCFKMPVIQCHITECPFATPDVDPAVAAVMLGHHLTSAHPAPVQRKAPTIPQPKVTGNIYEDQWDSFAREWAVYKETVSITDDKLPVYLLSCCSSDLKSNVEKANPTISTQTEVEVLAAIKRHAVVSVAASVLRTELLTMKQARECACIRITRLRKGQELQTYCTMSNLFHPTQSNHNKC